MADDLLLPPSIRVPASALEWKAVRSGGPGGQNVNKVASKVELRVDPGAIEGLNEGQRERLLARAPLDAGGNILLSSQKTREQRQNLDDVFDKLRVLISASLVAPRRRRPTRPGRGAIERRLEGKRRQSDKKAGRRNDD